jgi:prophage regulatory protein
MEDTTRLLRRRQVEALTGLKRSTIYQRLAEGTFPKQIHLGPRSVGWLASEVNAWIAERVAESRPASPDEAAREAWS